MAPRRGGAPAACREVEAKMSPLDHGAGRALLRQAREEYRLQGATWAVVSLALAHSMHLGGAAAADVDAPTPGFTASTAQIQWSQAVRVGLAGRLAGWRARPAAISAVYQVC
jgi:hypothetical protein